MRVLVKTLRGNTVTVECTPHDTIEIFKKKLQPKVKVPPDMQRLIFAGRQLEDECDLAHYKIAHQCTLYLVLPMRGMISTFQGKNDGSDAGVSYLWRLAGCRTPAEIQAVPVPASKFKVFGARNMCRHDFQALSNTGMLAPQQLQLMCDFLDFMWAQCCGGTVLKDLKLVVPDPLMAGLLELASQEVPPLAKFSAVNVVHNLVSLWVPLNNRSKFAFRITKGPTEACIPFHCDGANCLERPGRV